MVALALLYPILLSFAQGPANMHAREIDRVIRDRYAVMQLDSERTVTRRAMIDTVAIKRRLIYPKKELKAFERGSVMEEELSAAELRELEKTEGPFPTIDESLTIDQRPTYDEDELSRHIQYPEFARRNGIEGRVVIMVLVGRSGRVIRAIPEMESSGMFQHNAIEAIKKVHFKPALLGGEPVASWIKIPVVFKLAE